MVQVHVLARVWGFESLLRHQLNPVLVRSATSRWLFSCHASTRTLRLLAFHCLAVFPIVIGCKTQTAASGLNFPLRELAVEPCTGHRPFPLNRPDRDAQYFGGLF